MIFHRMRTKPLAVNEYLTVRAKESLGGPLELLPSLLLVSTSNKCHASSNKCFTTSNKEAIRIKVNTSHLFRFGSRSRHVSPCHASSVGMALSKTSTVSVPREVLAAPFPARFSFLAW